MLITKTILNKAIAEGSALFHDGDVIDDDVFYELFLAPNEMKICSNGQHSMMSHISRDTRKILCCEMTKTKEHTDVVYIERFCASCHLNHKISITSSQIKQKTFKLSSAIKHPNVSITLKNTFKGGYISYQDVFFKMFGANYVCPTCYDKFRENVDRKANEILSRKDKFEWYFSHDSNDDWRKGLFYKFCDSNNPEAYRIFAIDGTVWELPEYKIEEEKRAERAIKEKEHKRQLEEAKRQKEIEEAEERERVRRSNELFLARHQLNTPTQQYINTFCTKDSQIDITDRDVIEGALCPKNVRYEDIQKHNCTLYKEYLLTPLWRIISKKVKWNAQYRCENCGNATNLETHHTSYEFKGVEFLKMESLQCLCHECHMAVHEKDKKAMANPSDENID